MNLALVETGLPDLIRELGTEIGDPELSALSDGRSITKTYATSVIRAAAREIFEIYRANKAPALLFASEVPLPKTEQGYLLPPRFRSCLYVADGTTIYWAFDFALHINERELAGWMVGNGFIITRNLPELNNPVALITQVCPTPAFGQLVSVSGRQLTLQATPSLGETNIQPNYYLGATIAIESGNARGQSARIVAYNHSSQTVTIDRDLSPAPQSGDYYTFLIGIPACAIRPLIIKAAWTITRSMKRLGRDEVDFRAEFSPAVKTAVEAMRQAAYSQTLRFPPPPAVYRYAL